LKLRVTRLRIALLFLVVVLVILAGWTASSPPTLGVQSQSQLTDSLFSYAQSIVTQNFSDPSGNYVFKFGFDYPNASVPQGQHIQLAVYCALINQQISSFFERGISIALQSGSLLVDGKSDFSVKIISKLQSNIQIFYFQNPNTNIPVGKHNITARLVLSTIVVNYIGSYGGSTEIVTLNGLMNINASMT
jgi:hypothetical protein